MNDQPKTKPGEIRTDCYVHIFMDKKKENPDAHFEIITRATLPAICHTTPSVLSPNWPLLDAAKAEKWGMPQYYAELGRQFQGDPAALARIKELARIARSGTTVFLVCYEKDASVCHRTYVKMLVERELKFGKT